MAILKNIGLVLFCILFAPLVAYWVWQTHVETKKRVKVKRKEVMRLCSVVTEQAKHSLKLSKELVKIGLDRKLPEKNKYRKP